MTILLKQLFEIEFVSKIVKKLMVSKDWKTSKFIELLTQDFSIKWINEPTIDSEKEEKELEKEFKTYFLKIQSIYIKSLYKDYKVITMTKNMHYWPKFQIFVCRKNWNVIKFRHVLALTSIRTKKHKVWVLSQFLLRIPCMYNLHFNNVP